MKTISAGLATHYAQTVKTLATCWKCTRLDGQVFGFTDHDLALTVAAVTYRAESGYTRSAIRTAAALAVDNLDLEGVFESGQITEADIVAGLWDYCAIEIFEVNWADLTQGVMKLRKGRLGNVRTGRSAFTAELRGLLQNVQQEVGRIYGPECDADLGDARCGVVLGGSPSLFTFNPVVSTVTSNRVFSSASLASLAAEYCTGGKVTWLTGGNVGLSMEVKAFNSGSPQLGSVELALPMPYAIQAGNTFTITAGCNKTLATCKNKFNNVVNFRGFPYVPGTDRVVTGTG